MKEFKIEYKRENGTTDTETVFCKSVKLTKSIRDYYFHINAEILNVSLI